MTAAENLSGQQFGPLFHGTDADIPIGAEISGWATTSPLTAGLYGNRVYKVDVQGANHDSPVDYSVEERNYTSDSHGPFIAVGEIGNPHQTGECGRPNCDFDDHRFGH